MTKQEFARFMHDRLAEFEKEDFIKMFFEQAKDRDLDLGLDMWMTVLLNHIRKWFWKQGETDPLGRP